MRRPEKKTKRLKSVSSVKAKVVTALLIVGCVALCVVTEPAEEAKAEAEVNIPTRTVTVSVAAPELSEEERLLMFIEEQANSYNLSPALVKAVIQTESDFRADAVNYNGTCLGLMQINQTDTADWLAEQLGMMSYDLLDPYDNVQMGCFYLAYLRDLWLSEGFTDEDTFALMLLSYNRGVGGCKKWIAKNDDWYANSYVSEVLMHKANFEAKAETEV